MSRMSEYPDSPGFKKHGPSEEAAEKIAGKAAIMCGKILQAFKTRFPAGATADEIATELNISVLSVRPRVSELHRTGDLTETGERRKNASGMTATVWRYMPDQPPIQTAA